MSSEFALRALSTKQLLPASPAGKSASSALACMLICLLSIALASCGGDSSRRTHAGDDFDAPSPSPSPPPGFVIGGPSAAAPWNLTLLFSGDLHAQITPFGRPERGGLARHATLMRLIREQAAARGADVLTLNAGDNMEGSLWHEIDGGALVFSLLDELGYDVCQVGNHDHQFGVDRLYNVLAAAFPDFTQSMGFLWGNVDPRGLETTGASGKLAVSAAAIAAFENGFATTDAGSVDRALLDPPGAREHLFNQDLIFVAGGLKIGVFGLDTDEILYTAIPGQGELLVDRSGRYEGLVFHPPVESAYASRMVEILDDPDGDPTTDDGADLIVCVTHLGLDADLRLAAAARAPGGRRIDVIVGGHSHTRMNAALPVAHADGSRTLIVHAGARGEFLGRLDLHVDAARNRAFVLDSRLIDVSAAVPEDPEFAARIAAAANAAGGIVERFDDPCNHVVATSAVDLHLLENAPSTLGALGVDLVFREARVAVDADIAMLGSFQFRSGLADGAITTKDVAEVFPLHSLDPTGLSRDRLHVVELAGGLIDAPNPATLFDPLATPARFTGITRIEFLLELIYSLSDVIGGLSTGGGAVGDLASFLDGLQWAGISFVVDHDAPLFDRIATSSITIDGVPVTDRGATSLRLVTSAVLAEIAFPIVVQAFPVESPPGSGVLGPLFTYDPAAAETGIVLAEALSAQLAIMGHVDASNVSLGLDRARPQSPDLSTDNFSARVLPMIELTGASGAILVGDVGAGERGTLIIGIINAGETAALSARLSLFIDPTPDLASDDPDGRTDLQTGASELLIGENELGFIPANSGAAPGRIEAILEFQIPPTLAPGIYAIEPRISQVVSADPSRPERITANNTILDQLPALFVR